MDYKELSLNFKQKEAEKLEKKLRKAEFDFEDFLTQLRQIKKLGSLEQILRIETGGTGD